MATHRRSVDPDSIDDGLGKDHERIEALLNGLVDAVHKHSAAAPAVFEEVDQALRIHMKWEEEVLFPAVRVRASEAQKRSIESLQIDHERISETLKFLAACFHAWRCLVHSPASFSALIRSAAARIALTMF